MYAQTNICDNLRVNKLKELELLDTAPDPIFDSVIELAKQHFDVPIALISLVDADRQWFKAKIGLEVNETPRNIAFCDHTIKSDKIFVVEDATKDQRFFQNPLVLNTPNIRFYAGAPLNVDGHFIGTICIIDNKPKSFSKNDEKYLSLLARNIENCISLHVLLKNETKYKNILRENTNNEKRAELILQTMHDGLVLQNSQGKIVFSNPRACEILGYTNDELLNASSQDESWESVNEEGIKIGWSEHPSMKCLHSNKAVKDEVLGVKRPDGERIWLLVSAKPLNIDTEEFPQHVVVSFVDVTNEKKAFENLEILKTLAQSANDAKNAFLSNISHEIRTPLNGVIGCAEAIKGTNLDATQTSLIDIICQSGRELESVMKDIIELSALELGTTALECDEIEIKKLYYSIYNHAKSNAQKKGLVFENKYHCSQEFYFFGDFKRILQIAENLLSNAIKFTHSGSINLEIYIDKFNNLNLIVEDTGIGIEDAHKDIIFKSFTQIDASITRQYGGTGIGLSLVADLVNLMQGEIKLSSNLGIGSKFHVILPPIFEMHKIASVGK